MYKKLKAWLRWRGITPSDILYGVFSMGFLLTVTVLLLASVSC